MTDSNVADGNRESGFAGFLSYSHAFDRGLANALQYGLHGFAKAWYRARAIRVFQTTHHLAQAPRCGVP